MLINAFFESCHSDKETHLMKFLRIALLFLLLLCSCSQSNSASSFSYREKPFRAEIQGTLHTIPFTAEIGMEETERGQSRYIRFLSPASLGGIQITIDETGDSHATLGSIQFQADRTYFSGLLLPLEILFFADIPKALQKSDEGFQIKLEDNCFLYIDAHGTPVRVCSTNANYTVSWWENSIQ